MKRLLLFFVMSLSLQIYAGAASMDVQENKSVNIELGKGHSNNDDTYPRTLIPFTCVYADGMVQLTLIGEVGEYTLTVTNQLTGEQWLVENSLTLFVSGMSGIYLVQISTEDGSLYWGTYTL